MGDCVNEPWYNHTIEYTENREEWGPSLCRNMESCSVYTISWKKQRMNIMLTFKNEILIETQLKTGRYISLSVASGGEWG